GSLLLYFPVFILYFKPSIFRCIVLRWVRMLGFATVYGTITLKLYRVLKVFLSRSAQRAPYVSSGRVLKLLAPILLLVLWFLAAWTIGMLENVNKNIPLVIRTQTAHGLHFYICGHDCWDYMMVIVEDEPRPRTEICPWEEVAAPAGKEGLRQDTSKREGKPGSRGVGDTKARPGGRREQRGDTGMFAELVRKSLEKAESKKSQSMESIKEEICPWESLGTEKPPEQPPARSTALPKSPSGKSQSTESLKAEICPWEAQEPKSSDKANVCPWEGAEPPSGKEKLRPSTVSKSPSASQGLLKETGVGASGKEEKAKRDRESVCPWESLDMEQPQAKPHTGSREPSKKSVEICPWEDQEPKSSDKAEICPWESTEQPLGKARAGSTEPSKKSQSTESLKAEICPWEDQEPKSSDKAEICPWEGVEPPSQQPKAKQGSQGGSRGDKRITRQAALASPERSPGKGSRDREAVCPWESLGTQEPSGTSHVMGTGLPKSASGKSQSVESLKAEICPWEGQEPKSSDRAEICPWEGAEAQLDKGAAPGKDRVPPKSSKPVEKGSRDRESVCPWESMDTEDLSLKTAMEKEPSKKSDSTESRKSEICPWEAAEPTGWEKESSKAGVHPRGADRTSQPGMGKPKPVAGASAGSPTALLEKSKGSSDGEAKHKPLCRLLPGIQPPGTGSSPSPGTGLAEVCPWEAEEAPSTPAKPSTDTRKSSEVCPWEEESVDPTPTHHGQGRARGTPRDGEGGERETQPEVCPWDHQ
ncbi:probable G-protein coupled receptor 179, partial [Manacus vitellinus]|uniref:probable G-protein coupled receptor 179 n=1 Tax=Manacus vitellinus TaxID=328815 RepID=UPI00115F5356